MVRWWLTNLSKLEGEGMSKYIFKSLKDPENTFSVTDITFEVETVNRSEIIEAFIYFLKASGYNTRDLEEQLEI